jgi:hypothetical protein
MKTKVSLGFANLSDSELDNFAQSVIDSMTGNAAYPTPPVTLADVQTAKDDFVTRTAAAQVGGPPDTALKRNSRQTLEGMLRRLASYVQMMCAEDMAVLLRSGFQAQSTNTTRAPLTQPLSLVLKHASSGQLVGRVDPVKNTNVVLDADDSSGVDSFIVLD